MGPVPRSYLMVPLPLPSRSEIVRRSSGRRRSADPPVVKALSETTRPASKRGGEGDWDRMRLMVTGGYWLLGWLWLCDVLLSHVFGHLERRTFWGGQFGPVSWHVRPKCDMTMINSSTTARDTHTRTNGRGEKNIVQNSLRSISQAFDLEMARARTRQTNNRNIGFASVGLCLHSKRLQSIVPGITSSITFVCSCLEARTAAKVGPRFAVLDLATAVMGPPARCLAQWMKGPSKRGGAAMGEAGSMRSARPVRSRRSGGGQTCGRRFWAKTPPVWPTDDI